MRTATIFLLAAAACISVSWAAYQSAVPAEVNLSGYVPAGALLYLQANDFASLLSDWNKSSEKQRWLTSSNYEVFSRSRLLLRLKDASAEFAKAAGLPADSTLLGQIAGTQTALAIFDIGKLQFLYISKLPSTSSTQSALWQTREKFETRNAAGAAFFYRRDAESEREVAFAVNGDYLLLSTREDLLAGALQLMAGSKEHASIESEPWWSQSVAAAGPRGDLRMVLNLGRIVPSPYFRSYWIQQNITEMKKYSAAVSDLFRSGNQFREERVLLKKIPESESAAGTSEGADAVADVLRLVPVRVGFYEARANPSPEECSAALETGILARHVAPVARGQLAPQLQLSDGQAGMASDLETPIDQPPPQRSPLPDISAELKSLFIQNRPRAILQIQTSQRSQDAVFIRIHPSIVFLAESDWNEPSVRSSIVDFLRPNLSIGQLGLEWRDANGYSALNGLWNLAVAARGKYLIISDDPVLLASILSNMTQTPAGKPAIRSAEFNHSRERENFALLTGLLAQPRKFDGPGRNPEFFSENVGSLSDTLGDISTQKIVVRDAGNRITQTVTYEWAH